jgi:hypothetical protein
MFGRKSRYNCVCSISFEVDKSQGGKSSFGHSQPFPSIPIHSRPFPSIPIHSQPFSAIPIHSHPFPSIRSHSQPFEWLGMSFFPLDKSSFTKLRHRNFVRWLTLDRQLDDNKRGICSYHTSVY